MQESVDVLLKQWGKLIQGGRAERESQSQFAKRLGVGRSTVSALENGSAQVAVGTYLQAMLVLGLAGTFADWLSQQEQEQQRQRFRHSALRLDNDF